MACGHSHSLALVQNEESLKEHVYSWGLGSSGQLGLPKEQLQDNSVGNMFSQKGSVEIQGCQYGFEIHHIII